MKCPRCSLETQVLATRTRPDGVKRRRYVCLGPRPHRFSTIEQLAQPDESQRGTPLVTRKAGQ